METLLTRRQTLQSLAYSAVLGGPLLGLVGCGGGGRHGGGASTDSASVAVQVPSGFPIAATDLQAGTAYGTGTVANGAFKAKVSDKGPTFAYLQQKSTGAYLMFGLVGHGRPGLSSLSSAALAVALALGITALPAKGLTQAMALLEADANVQALAATISTTLASDPLALTNGNTTISAAIKTAVDAIGGGAAPALARSVSRADPAPLVLVQPSGDQGGAEVVQADDADYVVPTNTKRRPIAAYTYLVGHVAADGTKTDVSPATRIDQQDIEPTNSLVGSVASLGAKAAFGPVSGSRVSLPVSANDTKTLFETVVLMATGDNAAADPAFFSDAKYAGETADWRTKLGDLNVHALLGGILFDLFQSVLGGVATAVSATQAQVALATIEAAEAAAAESVVAAARAGKLGDAAHFLLTRIAPNDLLLTTRYKYRQAILELLGEGETAAATAAEGAQGIALAGIASFALAALAAAGTLVGVADVAASYFDTLFSPKGEIWTAAAIVPSVAISPASAKIDAGTSLTLSAATPGVSETNYKFHWTLSAGGNGNIGDPSGTGGAGHDVTTTGNLINLLTAKSDVDGAVYAITVAAIDLKTGETLGKASAKVTISKEIEGNGRFSILDFPKTVTYNGQTYKTGVLVAIVQYPASVPPPANDVYGVTGTGPYAGPPAGPRGEGGTFYNTTSYGEGDQFSDGDNYRQIPLTTLIAQLEYSNYDDGSGSNPMSRDRFYAALNEFAPWTWTVTPNDGRQ